MYSADDIRNVTFKKAGRGYNAEDVDIFAEQIAADYEIILREMNSLRTENQRLSEELKNTSCSQSSLQNILISAQRLADQIVDEAKQKAEDILLEAKKAALEASQQMEADKEACRMQIQQANDTAQKELERLLKDGVKKSEAVKTATADSIERQQLLFDKLKTEIVAFKAQIMDMYKEHLNIFSQIPDEVPFDAKRAAEAVTAIIDAQPDFEAMVNGTNEEIVEEPVEVLEQELDNEPKEQVQPPEELGFTRVMDIPVTSEE